MVAVLDDAMAGPVTPLAFSATAVTEIRDELRRAELLYRSHRIPMINSSAKSVEEMSTVILQSLKHN